MKKVTKLQSLNQNIFDQKQLESQLKLIKGGFGVCGDADSASLYAIDCYKVKLR